MQRRPKLSPMAERAVVELDPKRNITRLGVVKVLVKYEIKYIIFCCFGLVYIFSLQPNHSVAKFVILCCILGTLIVVFLNILNAYYWVVDYRRWAEGLRLEPAHFFEKEIKAGLLKPEDIEPKLLRAGPVADKIRKEIAQARNKNLTQIMGPYFAKDKHGNLLNPKKI